MIKKKKKKDKTIGKLLVPVTFNYSSNLPSVSKSIIAVGSEIYVIGGPVDYAPFSAVRVLDCCTHTWRDAPSMNIFRMNALACLHDGKKYVVGGCQRVESCVEVFDIKAQTWERLPYLAGAELRNFYILCRLADIKGSECVMENVLYRFGDSNGRRGCFWYYDIWFGWERVKGLDSLVERYDWDGSTSKLVSCDGKLLLIWQGCKNRSPDGKKIWGAEIVLEKGDGGEVWGKAEWVDVLYTVPRLCQKLLHFLVVSV